MYTSWATPLKLLLVCLSLCFASSSLVAAEKGEAQVYTFSDLGKPLQGVQVVSGSVSSVTDTSGYAKLVLPEGRQVISLLHNGTRVGEVAIVISAGQVSEAVVTVSKNKPLKSDVESAESETQIATSTEVITDWGVLEGLVINLKKQEPVMNAHVLVRGHSVEAKTDDHGKFNIKLPVGTHTISVIHPEYATQNMDDIQIDKDVTTGIKMELTPSAIELDAFQVVAVKITGGIAELVEERKESQRVLEIIGAEQMSKSGDSDAAAALKRVTGITVVGGRFVYVRGMGERYSSSLLNGAVLPSPELEKRVVPLDIFPVDVIESVVIQKTYTADMPGEFGGGAIQIRTRKIPEKKKVSFGLSLKYNNESTFKDGYSYEGGGNDWLGMDDGTRAMPEALFQASQGGEIFPKNILGEGLDDDELESLGESLPNIWNAERSKIPLGHGFNFTYANRFEPKGIPLGVSGSFLYSDDSSNTEEIYKAFRVGNQGALAEKASYDRESTSRKVDLGGLLNFGLEPHEDHSLEFTNLLVRVSKDRAEVYEGYYDADSKDIRVTELQYLEQQLLSYSLKGNHKFSSDLAFDRIDGLKDNEYFSRVEGVEFDWNFTHSKASREMPDYRKTRFDYEPSDQKWYLGDRSSNQRKYNSLYDYTDDLTLKFKVPFEVQDELKADLNVGMNSLKRERSSDTRRFMFQSYGPDSRDDNILSLSAEEIFTPEYIGTNGFRLQEVTWNTDNYSASQEIMAYFLMLNYPIREDLSLNVGVRNESSNQKVTTFALFKEDAETIEANLDVTDTLPAFNLTWKQSKAHQLRAGYSKTVSRPDFRELSNVQWEKVIGEGSVVGNPDLKRATIDNFDFRWEWYISENETVSLGLFHKILTNPIETIIYAGADLTESFQNVPGATNTGIEFDVRRNFSFLLNRLSDYFISTNITYINSEVSIDSGGVETSKSRPLSGQSEYVINLQAGYDNPDDSFSWTILFNTFGERITKIGSYGLPDVMEEPFSKLDFVCSKKYGSRSSFKLKIQNLLNESSVVTQGGKVKEESKKGISISLGYGWSL